MNSLDRCKERAKKTHRDLSKITVLYIAILLFGKSENRKLDNDQIEDEKEKHY